MARQLITQQEVIERAIPSSNFDDALIKDSYIEAAEWDYLRPVLGDDLYDLVKATPSDYASLMVYIKDYLAWGVLMKAMPFIHYQISSNGIQLNFTEHGRTATNDDKQRLVDGVKSILDDYKEKLQEYLTDNYSTYTQYANKVSDKGNDFGIIL